MSEAETSSSSTWLTRVCPDTETGRLVATFDWASTSLGPPENWPVGLRVAASTCMTSLFPMLVAWGPDLVMIYNDGYRDLLGTEKHPGAVGTPAERVWSEVWDEIEPMFRQVLTTGEPIFLDDLELFLDRNGYPEETHFLFCYSPLFDDDASVGGVLDIVVEITDQAIARRRLAATAALTEAMQGVLDITGTCIAATAALAEARRDVTSADIFLEIDGKLVAVASNRSSTTPPLTAIEIADIKGPEAIHIAGDGPTADGPATCVVLPIGRTGPMRGALVVVPSPNRPFDEPYVQFLRLIAHTIDSALQVSYQHAAEIGEYRRISETLQDAMLDPVDDVATIAARYVPAAGNLSVGGDWYDVIEIDADRRGLVVGDCVGHGLDAAAAMAQLRSVARAALLEGRDPASVLDALDLFAARIEDANLATVVVMTVDRSSGQLTYSRAGHIPPLVVGPTRSRWLEGAGAPPLAVLAPADHTNGNHVLDEDEILVLCSDGLVERRTESLDVGMARLESVVRAARTSGVQEIADQICEDLVPERPADDVVFIVKRLDDASH